jgi:hypothetical protein
VGRHREINLQGNSLQRVGLDRRVGGSAEPSHLLERLAIVGPQETLKVKLMLDDRRLVQLTFEIGAEHRIGQRAGESAREAVHDRSIRGLGGCR